MALAKNHKTISGKVNLVKMLRDLRCAAIFHVTEQYQHQAAGRKTEDPVPAIRDSDNKEKSWMIMPVTEIDRANMIFERIRYTGQPEQARQDAL